MTIWGKTCNRLPLIFHWVCIYYVLFILSPVDGYLGCFQLLAIVNNAVMNTDIHVSVQIPAFNSFGYTHKSEIAGSHMLVLCLPFFNNCQTVFHSSCRNFSFNILIIALQYNWFLPNPMYFLVCIWRHCSKEGPRGFHRLPKGLCGPRMSRTSAQCLFFHLRQNNLNL